MIEIPVFLKLRELPPRAPRAKPPSKSRPDRVKISDHEVATMRFMKAEGMTHGQICAEFPQFSVSYIQKIISRKVRN